MKDEKIIKPNQRIWAGKIQRLQGTNAFAIDLPISFFEALEQQEGDAVAITQDTNNPSVFHLIKTTTGAVPHDRRDQEQQ